VLPTLGENFGHAIFESLAAGRPVLISDQTPWRNLKQDFAGWDIALANGDEFKKVANMMVNMDNDQLNRWCKGAWMYCHKYLSENNLKNDYINVFASKN
jgi:glycosyltransferase involved in cell wall biosynthesis